MTSTRWLNAPCTKKAKGLSNKNNHDKVGNDKRELDDKLATARGQLVGCGEEVKKVIEDVIANLEKDIAILEDQEEQYFEAFAFKFGAIDTKGCERIAKFHQRWKEEAIAYADAN